MMLRPSEVGCSGWGVDGASNFARDTSGAQRAGTCSTCRTCLGRILRREGRGGSILQAADPPGCVFDPRPKSTPMNPKPSTGCVWVPRQLQTKAYANTARKTHRPPELLGTKTGSVAQLLLSPPPRPRAQTLDKGMYACARTLTQRQTQWRCQ